MPEKQKLIATRTLTYATRRLQAGESFEAVNRDARVLKAIGKACDDYDAPVKQVMAKPPAAIPTPAALPPQPVFQAPEPTPPLVTPPGPPVAPEDVHHDPDPLDGLRSEAEALGVRVDRRWGETRLVQEIDAALENQPAPDSAKAEATSPTAMTTRSASALMHPGHASDEE